MAPTFKMRRVDSWTENHSDARVLVNARGIGTERLVRGLDAAATGPAVIDVPPAWQQRQLQFEAYRQPSMIAAALVFVAGLMVLFGCARTTMPRRATSRPRARSPARPMPRRLRSPERSRRMAGLHLEHAMGTLFDLASHGTLVDSRGPARCLRTTQVHDCSERRATRPLARHEQALVDRGVQRERVRPTARSPSTKRGHISSGTSRSSRRSSSRR